MALVSSEMLTVRESLVSQQDQDPTGQSCTEDH